MDQQQGWQGSSGTNPGQRRRLPVIVIHVRVAPAGCGDQGIEAANGPDSIELGGEIARRGKGISQGLLDQASASSPSGWASSALSSTVPPSERPTPSKGRPRASCRSAASTGLKSRLQAAA